jgi:hypothetical protein
MTATYLLLLIGLIALPINSQNAVEYLRNGGAKFNLTALDNNDCISSLLSY